jgi:UDP-N-acetylglucosamine 2-epimerase
VEKEVLLREYSEEQIKSLIEIIKDCVRESRFTISLEDSKIENTQFIEEYNINEKKRMNILYNLDYKDFCYGLQNMRDGVEQNNLYVFCIQKELYNLDNKQELVDIYLKFNIVYNNNSEYYILVSLHKRNKPITYLFK